MTVQAVGNRIKKFEENGVIKAYSLVIDEIKLGLPYIVFVIVYMETANRDLFVHSMCSRQSCGIQLGSS